MLFPSKSDGAKYKYLKGNGYGKDTQYPRHLESYMLHVAKTKYSTQKVLLDQSSRAT